MKTTKIGKLLVLILALGMCISALTACFPPAAGSNEAKYEEAYALLEQGEYEQAYALFVELGDYKDAAKQAAYFRYLPTNHRVEYVSEEGDETITYTVTLNDKNLLATVVEEYSTGSKHTCTFTYNEFGHVTRRACSDTDGTTSLYEAIYDANGNLIKEICTDPEGNVSQFDYTYNEKGEMVKVVPINAPDYYTYCTLAYDEQGREICVVYEYEDGRIVEESIYNESGNIVKKIWTEADGTVSAVYDYFYDEKDRLVEILFMEEGEDGGFRRTTYNDKDQIYTEHIYYSFGYECVYTYEYDAHGNLIKTTYDNIDGQVGDDVTESVYRLVYLPYEYSEEEWTAICDATLCWDVTHQ